MDVSGDGRVNFKEFATVLLNPPRPGGVGAGLGGDAADAEPPMEYHSLDSMIIATDTDKDGRVSWDEFRQSPFAQVLAQRECERLFRDVNAGEWAESITLKQVPLTPALLMSILVQVWALVVGCEGLH